MGTPVLICDDSPLARKQLARALPGDWDAALSFAGGGEEGLAAVRAGRAEVLFLDLNMPDLDGYQVLEAIRREDLPAMVIVVSGDIQPEARERVLHHGALAFIKKPVEAGQLAALLQQFGLYSKGRAQGREVDLDIDLRDCYQEIVNVAMGRAADLLARLLGAFVVMPIPHVNTLEPSELRMALAQVHDGASVSAICQGFIGPGVAGEALLLFNDASYKDIARLMRFEGQLDGGAELELLMDTSSILIGACLQGIADQLDFKFSQGHPVVLQHRAAGGEMLSRNAERWNKMLAVEMGYTIENHNISCDLLLIFTEDSIDRLNELVSFVAD